MEQADFAARLERAGLLVAPEEWPLLRLLFAGDKEANSVLADTGPPERLFATLEEHGLCGWLLARLNDAEHASSAWRDRLQSGAAKEFAACALRRHALLQLDAACAGCEQPPLILKGGANAVLYYEQESARPSHDIDLFMTRVDAARCFPGAATAGCGDDHNWGPSHHIKPFYFAGYKIELHQFVATSSGWGQYEDFRAKALPLPGFQHLHGPGPIEAFTLALLHFNFHVGSFTYDFHDMDCIARDPGFNWADAEALWCGRGLLPIVLPPLAVYAALSPDHLGDRWGRLYSTLPLGARLQVSIGLRLLASRRFTRLRKDWFCTRLSGWPLLRPLAARIAGSRHATRSITGRDEKDIRFWLAHYVGLPARRLLSFWR